MVWIADGTRLTRDLPRFTEGRRSLQAFPWCGIFTTPFPAECFPRDWLDSRVPGFFDFAGTGPIEAHATIERRLLWGLLPGRADDYAVFIALQRQNLLKAAHRHPQIVVSQKIGGTLGARFRAARVAAMLEASRYPMKEAWKPRYRSRRSRRRVRF